MVLTVIGSAVADIETHDSQLKIVGFRTDCIDTAQNKKYC
jgi:hypothetical protein